MFDKLLVAGQLLISLVGVGAVERHRVVSKTVATAKYTIPVAGASQPRVRTAKRAIVWPAVIYFFFS